MRFLVVQVGISGESTRIVDVVEEARRRVEMWCTVNWSLLISPAFSSTASSHPEVQDPAIDRLIAKRD